MVSLSYSHNNFHQHISQMSRGASLASMYSAIYGNPKAFLPIWIISGFFFNYLQPFRPFPYPLFDITSLKKTLSSYVDFNGLRNPNRPRLIVTSTDIQTSEPVIFDSKHRMDAKR
jgi:NTE family protein